MSTLLRGTTNIKNTQKLTVSGLNIELKDPKGEHALFSIEIICVKFRCEISYVCVQQSNDCRCFYPV